MSPSFRIATVLLGVFALAGCEKSQAPATPVVAVDPVPMDAAKEAFAGCEWGKVTGSGLSVWSYGCGPDKGGQSLIADDEVGGFAIIADGLEPNPVIRTFAKDAAAPIDAILPALRAASPGPHTATCALEPMTVEGRDTVYILSPTGTAKTHWAAVEAGEPNLTDTDPPCGDLGVGFSGDRYLQVLKGDPTRVVYVDAGSEIQIFDPSTIVAN
ncbi:hypothetical protein BH10PSE1_BH10PSE1_05980 [soil metagenome]